MRNRLVFWLCVVTGLAVNSQAFAASSEPAWGRDGMVVTSVSPHDTLNYWMVGVVNNTSIARNFYVYAICAFVAP